MSTWTPVVGRSFTPLLFFSSLPVSMAMLIPANLSFFFFFSFFSVLRGDGESFVERVTRKGFDGAHGWRNLFHFLFPFFNPGCLGKISPLSSFSLLICCKLFLSKERGRVGAFADICIFFFFFFFYSKWIFVPTPPSSPPTFCPRFGREGFRVGITGKLGRIVAWSCSPSFPLSLLSLFSIRLFFSSPPPRKAKNRTFLLN